MRVLAGIVAYQPDFQQLRKNINALEAQVDQIVIWDNGGADGFDRDEDIVVLTDNQRNIGIAAALNRLCEYAEKNGFEWILTMDQDSIIPDNLISNYLRYVGNERVALLCPPVLELNGNHTDITSDVDAEYVEMCITSGSFLRISAWRQIGGFWDELFIDNVDYDICWSLTENHWKILRVNGLPLCHSLAHSRRVRFLNREEIVFNHSPLRCYYIVRNTIAVGRKHNKKRQCFRWNMKRILLVNLYEKNRWEKNKMMLKGIWDGLRIPIPNKQ